MRARWIAALVALVLVVAAVVVTVVVFTGKGGSDASRGGTIGPSDRVVPTGSTADVDPYDPAYDPAQSTPREDSYYPAQGDPGVDTLHYGLDLTWNPSSRTLTGIADIAFRATADADHVQLDLLDSLRVESLTVDGANVDFAQGEDHLVIHTDVHEDRRYALEIDYAGTPAPVPAPTTRPDFSNTGMNITPTGEIWTMQEPFGAFTWYPVNDQPSDKAFYDITIRAPRNWVGVANGELESRTTEGGHTVTTWHLSHPASSYLTTVAVGDFVETKDVSASGVPLSYWTHRGDARALRALRKTPQIMTWDEQHLGPYPFDSLGLLVVDSDSGMETQTMITLGNTAYTRSPAVIEHELTHQWYGDLVTPTDWRDVWMNEGMTMFLQGVFEADREGVGIDAKMDEWASYEAQSRRTSGPPGAYDKGEFGEGNIYYGPALMWNELRHRLGDATFWAMVQKWPTVHADGNATREEYYDWIEQETGRELSSFFDEWIMGRTTPHRS